MNESGYSSSYLKIYFWQGIALFLKFFSMFIVIPYISSDKELYGIYAVCISVLIFLNYADLGFLKACNKFGAECYAKKNMLEEIRFIGFGGFVLLVIGFIAILFFVYLSFHPEIIVKEIQAGRQFEIASSLFLILSFAIPVIILQRIISVAFEIRLKSYINMKVNIIASLIQLLSVFYFFRTGTYDLLGYFLFGQILLLLVTVIMYYTAYKAFNYQIFYLFKSFRFSTDIYIKSSNLAYSGLFVMFMFVLFYELDRIVISKYMGASAVALFAIAASIPKMMRSIFGIVFAPLATRANYFIGNKDEGGLINYTKNLISLTASITIFPAVAISIISGPYITTWVGVDYNDSIPLAAFLALVFSMSFLTYLISSYLNAKLLIKEIYISYLFLPLIYWIGITLTFDTLGLLSFPVFKLGATLLSVVYYFYLGFKHQILNWNFLVSDLIKPIFWPLFFLIITLFAIKPFLPIDKSKLNFFIVIGSTGSVLILSYFLQYLLSNKIRNKTDELFKQIFAK